MIVELSGDGDQAALLREVDDFRRFHIEAGALTDDEVNEALTRSGAGTRDGDHAWISMTFLERNGRPDSDQWRDAFAAMVSFAAKNGCASADGDAIRAHINRAVK